MNCTIEEKKAKDVPAVERAEKPSVRPDYRSERREDGYHVEVVVPGVPKSGVSVSVEDGVLTVEGVRADSVPESWRPIRVELGKPDYRLKLKLSDEIDPDGIRASVEAGVLSLELPIREAVKPRVIEIQ